VVGGIDTHADLHQAAVIDSIGRHLATEQFETTPDGYRRLLDWLRSHGEALAVGIEGTGAYGAEIARFLTANEVTVVEVDRPDRKARRDNGKSVPIDAYAAATAVLSGRAAGTHPRPATGSWRRSGHCGWSARALSRPAPRPSTRSAPSSSPPPPASATSCAACP
jgi:transposase